MEKTFVASRLAGNWFFRPSVTLTPTGLRYEKPKLFGGSEELIHYKHIASVRISSGLLFSTVTIETSGGSAPVTISGLYKSEARELREGIEAAQATH
ncbi:MAG: hypothetical protein V4550_10025 [Gemmatimonadota bacterium]